MKTKISKLKCRAISVKYGESYSFYRDAAGPAPKGWRWLNEGEIILADDASADWDGTFNDPKDYVGKAYQTGFLPFARKIEAEAPKAEPKFVPKTLKIERCAERNIGGTSIVVVRIVEQSHREKDFGRDGREFKAKNGFVLMSYDYPDDGVSNHIYLRGKERAKDDQCVILSSSEYTELVKAVAEYNAFFAAPPAPKVIKTVAFNYLGGSARGYRVVDVTSEDATHIKGLDKSLNAPRTYLKSKIEGKVLEVKA